MKNAHFLALIAATALSTTMGTAQAEERVVNIYNWSDYIDDSVLESFTQKTGIKVVYSVYDNNSMLETKLLAGNSGFDIVVPSLDFLGRQIQAGIFQKLDKSKLPNLANMDKDIEKITAGFDPNNAYSINYMWGTVGLGMNEAKIKALYPEANLKSWSILFDPDQVSKIAECGVYMLDASDGMIPIVMSYLGLDPKSTDPKDIAQAEAVLLKVRPHIKKFDSSEYISALANGDICLAVGYSGDVLQARDRAAEAKNGVTVSYAIPNEGTQIWFDQMAIPADAKNQAEALLFLNYIMQPENIAKSSNYVNYANGNAASLALLDDAVKSDPGIYPDADTKAKLFASPPLSPKAQRAFNKTWTKVKAAK